MEDSAIVMKRPSSQSSMTSTQQLHMDFHDVTLDNDEHASVLETIFAKLAQHFGWHVMQVQTVRYTGDNPGVSAFCFLAETGHVSWHGWSKSRTAILDLVVTSDHVNLAQEADYIAQQFGASLSSTTHSVLARGGNDKDNEPLDELMASHQFKEKLVGVKSGLHNVQIWKQHNEESTLPSLAEDVQLFVDGELRMSLQDEVQYHESFVHPAMVASSVPPQRVLIIGGAEGGGLVRETLKWESVQEVVLVHSSNDAMLSASRTHMASLNNCTGFGHGNCLDDERVTVHSERFDKWFKSTFGKKVCKRREKNDELLFDVILLDWWYVDDENLDEEDFFEDLSCALGEFGVLLTAFGQGPSPAYGLALDRHGQAPKDDEQFEDYEDKLYKMMEMSQNFFHRRVYDIALESTGSLHTFSLGVVPMMVDNVRDDKDLLEGVFDGRTNGGINDFDGRPARVNLKLRRGLMEGLSLSFYDGVVQHSFRHPLASWKQVYCADPANRQLCTLDQIFGRDYNEEIFEYHADAVGGGNSGIVAKRDIKKGTVTGWVHSKLFCCIVRLHDSLVTHALLHPTDFLMPPRTWNSPPVTTVWRWRH